MRIALAQFAQARIEYDVCPTGRTGRALEDAMYTLCVMTGVRTNRAGAGCGGHTAAAVQHPPGGR
ncbi:DUF5133 domain-containing protein [Streptomyces sp. NPDC102405]|uniref:DUF5133 domain-containing protein n=1 Tax=Streptomyces sp. NPDC102405 TaxID=3366170 RepID=UPI003805ED5A